jgi:hypothetical protein
MSEQAPAETLTAQESLRAEAFARALADIRSVIEFVHPGVIHVFDDQFHIEPRSVSRGMLNDATKIEIGLFSDGSYGIEAVWGDWSNSWQIGPGNNDDIYAIYANGEIGSVSAGAFANMVGPHAEGLTNIFESLHDLAESISQGAARIID